MRRTLLAAMVTGALALTAACVLAMAPIGPSHAWGAIVTRAGSARALTFHSAVMPPT